MKHHQGGIVMKYTLILFNIDYENGIDGHARFLDTVDGSSLFIIYYDYLLIGYKQSVDSGIWQSRCLRWRKSACLTVPKIT